MGGDAAAVCTAGDTWPQDGKTRRPQVGDGWDGGQVWIAIEHGRKAGYVCNNRQKPRCACQGAGSVVCWLAQRDTWVLADDAPRQRQERSVVCKRRQSSRGLMGEPAINVELERERAGAARKEAVLFAPYEFFLSEGAGATPRLRSNRRNLDRTSRPLRVEPPRQEEPPGEAPLEERRRLGRAWRGCLLLA